MAPGCETHAVQLPMRLVARLSGRSGVARWSKRSARFFNTFYHCGLTDSKLDADLYRIWIFAKGRYDLSARFFRYRRMAPLPTRLLTPRCAVLPSTNRFAAR